MNAKRIERLVGCIGKRFQDIVATGLIDTAPRPSPLFDGSDNDDLVQDIGAGIELWYWAETQTLRKIHITLRQTVGQKIYNGELPKPFSHRMTRDYVRNMFGQPTASKQPGKLPGGFGMRGGSDTYSLTDEQFPNTKVTFSYLADFSVNALTFTPIDSGGKS